MGKKMIIKGLILVPNANKTYFIDSEGTLKTGAYWTNGTYVGTGGGDDTKLLTIPVKRGTRLGVFSGALSVGYETINQMVLKKEKEGTSAIKTLNYTVGGIPQLQYMDITEDGYVDISFSISVSPLSFAYYVIIEPVES